MPGLENARVGAENRQAGLAGGERVSPVPAAGKL